MLERMRMADALGTVLALTLGAGACAGREKFVTVLGPGVVNNPANRSLRFDLLKFGLDSFCREMLSRGLGLKLRDDEPVLGRFFADSCSSQVIDEDTRKSLVVQFSGKGYAWLGPGVGKVGFRAGSVVEYSPDFQLHEGALYVYFRTRNVDSSSFETQLIESGAAQSMVSLLGWAVPANEAGGRVVKSQLERGFTVIRYGSEGETDFGLGFVPKGQKPWKPFDVQASHKLTLANDRSEVHSGQQDYLGGFQVTAKEQALSLTIAVDGTPALDLLVVNKAYADMMLGRFVGTAGPAPLPGAALVDEPITAGQLYKRTIPVPPGVYYLVLDNSAVAGRTPPSAAPGDDRAGKVDYLVQLGDRP
jgi:hypothetical protein